MGYNMWDNFTRQYKCVKISHILYNAINMLNTSESVSENSMQQKLHTALHRVLKPLVRLALSHGINYPIILETLKSVFVQVAEKDFKLTQREQTDSRISLLTGLHRKDVHRLRESPADNESLSILATLGSQLVGLWISAPDFTDHKGKPKPLPRLASVGGDSSFERLVASVSKDIRARPVLDEWLRVGVVYIDENDCVCLNKDAFIPSSGFEEKLYFFQQNIHDHIAATTHNIMNITPPMLERCVYYEQMSPAAISELNALAEEQAMIALKAVNKRAIELQKKLATSTDANQRFTFAMYFYHTKEDPHTKVIYDDHQKKNQQ
jgi:hypothetical protein